MRRVFNMIKRFFKNDYVAQKETVISPTTPRKGVWRIVDNMTPDKPRQTGFGSFNSREEAQDFMDRMINSSVYLRNSGYEIEEA